MNVPSGLGKRVGGSRLGAVFGWGCIVLACVWGIAAFVVVSRHPRSDAAVVSAPVVGIASRVSGPIIELPVRENDFVEEGGLLFRIDPEPYELAVAAAAANLAAVRADRENAAREVLAQERRAEAAEAALAQARAVEAGARETYERLAPLLPKRYASAEEVDEARHALRVAEAGSAAARAALEAARADVLDPAPALAREEAAAAALETASLAVRDCTVRAPFPCRVAGMNLAVGAFVRPAVDVFTLIDTRQWRVVAQFSEGELRDLQPGRKVRIELMTAPGSAFDGEIESVAYGVTDMPQDPFPGLPIVMKELDWVRLAQKFPVRVKFSGEVPVDALRVGATAVVTAAP